MSGDFQNGENRYLKPCWWILWSAKATPRYGDLVLLGHRGGGRVQVGAEAAQVGHDALGGERLQPARRSWWRRTRRRAARARCGIFLPADAHVALRVDLLDGDLVTGSDLGAAGAVAAGERHHRADLDRLGPGRSAVPARAAPGPAGRAAHRVVLRSRVGSSGLAPDDLRVSATRSSFRRCSSGESGCLPRSRRSRTAG